MWRFPMSRTPAPQRFSTYGRDNMHEKAATTPPALTTTDADGRPAARSILSAPHGARTCATRSGLLARRITAGEVCLRAFPFDPTVRPSGCIAGCRLCEQFHVDADAYVRANGKDVPPPTWPQSHTSRAPGPDGVRAEFLRWPCPPDHADATTWRRTMSQVLSALFNCVLRDGVLPDEWVEYQTVPLFKEPKPGATADRADPADYRFITVGNMNAAQAVRVRAVRAPHALGAAPPRHW